MASRQAPRPALPPWPRSASVPDPILPVAPPEQGRRNDESWIEISSQPSSSSVSSIGDEIITTGLRVGHGSVLHRRRRLHHQHQHQHQHLRQQHQQNASSSTPSQALAAVAGTSSQDEYDETESEEDRVITSSTEQLHPSASRASQRAGHGAGADAETDEYDQDDENATALGRAPSSPSFKPQPNAFSHPPAHVIQRRSTPGTTITALSSQPQPHHSRSSHNRTHRSTQPGFMSPAYQADNDAVLRASLTTLLSCAAAARGLPRKEGEDYSTSGRGGGGGGSGGVLLSPSQPLELRLVPESELMTDGPAKWAQDQNQGSSGIPRPANQSGHSKNSSSKSNRNKSPSAKSTSPKSPAPSSADAPSATTSRTKRAAANRVAKKKQRTSSSPTRLAADDSTTSTTTLAATLLSPTVLAWIVSAGVVVLATAAISFRAGFITGRDAGRQEGAYAALHGLAVGGGGGGASSNATSVGASCGTDAIRSSTGGGTLRRFKWGSVGRGVMA